ncbi:MULTISPECIES: Gfo/Idh/MocA family oxidoreductase [unclassified Microbacterium]|uniref:Gfo/Idh/MocA family oxidoreductase n=1 Tax=Microbacterium TaxID=33882 RepID=UPI003BA1751D
MAVKVGVIGVGLAGTAHVNTLNRWVAGADVVAVADIALERAREVAALCPGDVAPFADPIELIDSVDVEAVVITSIARTHAELVLACISRGKPVFCEKPLAVTAEECRTIVDAEIASGKHLVQVGFMRRFDPSYLALKEATADGQIGDVVAIHAAHRNASVPGSFTSEMHVTEALIHEIDVHRWLLEDEYVDVQVDATATDGQLLDPQHVRFRTAAGRHIDVEVFVNAGYGYDIRCEVVGRKGTASLAGAHAPVVNSAGASRVGHHADFRTRFAEAYRDELVVWIDGIARGEVDGPNSWDGYVAAVVSDAAIAALHSGEVEPVSLPAKPDFY